MRSLPGRIYRTACWGFGSVRETGWHPQKGEVRGTRGHLLSAPVKSPLNSLASWEVIPIFISHKGTHLFLSLLETLVCSHLFKMLVHGNKILDALRLDSLQESCGRSAWGSCTTETKWQLLLSSYFESPPPFFSSANICYMSTLLLYPVQDTHSSRCPSSS